MDDCHFGYKQEFLQKTTGDQDHAKKELGRYKNVRIQQ
jgi:hypothetical protein